MSDNIIQLNEDLIKHDLKDLVRSSVEETLNALLDKEADELVNAQKYERSCDRQGYRSGHYKRNFHTTAGEVELKVSKLKGVPFETAIIERYRRRESSVEEALIEMYLAGVFVRRVEDITEALWGTKVSPSTIINLNKKAYEHIESWRSCFVWLKERGLSAGHWIVRIPISFFVFSLQRFVMWLCRDLNYFWFFAS